TAMLLEPRRAIDEEASGVDLRRHVRELPLDRLEVADAVPELLALDGVRAGDVVCRLSDPERLCGDADPSAVECRHRDPEAAPLLVQESVAPHVRSVDREIRRDRGVEAELLLLARHANVLLVEDEARDAARTGRRGVGAGEEDESAGDRAVRDPLL